MSFIAWRHSPCASSPPRAARGFPPPPGASPRTPGSDRRPISGILCALPAFHTQLRTWDAAPERRRCAAGRLPQQRPRFREGRAQTRLRPRLRTGDEEGPARRHSVRGRVCVRARLMHRLAVDCPQQRSRSESAQQPQPKLSRPWQFTEDGVALFQVGVGGLASLVERELHPGRRRHRLPPRLDLLCEQPLP